MVEVIKIECSSMRSCNICGSTEDLLSSRRRCRTCYNRYMANYMLERYHRRRGEAIISLGGRCFLCGSTINLELDHKDRLTKQLDLGKLFAGASETVYQKELRKCQVLCRTCHRKKTSQELSVPHGGGVSGKRNCSCAPCKEKRREYMHNYVRAPRA